MWNYVNDETLWLALGWYDTKRELPLQRELNALFDLRVGQILPPGPHGSDRLAYEQTVKR